ncbi:response regulator [Cohnella sp. WQ 127256]|uniref:response regulator n=1 Tax=Cohnella sp. WQ 127256 TaxID=2938790 RepID=UPI002118139F|nr:response regulator [Cohnella sp. WQ 127256]
MVNVVVVDDEERIRLGLAKLIAQVGKEFQVTGIFAGAQELLSHIDSIHVDLVITDIKMPVMNGLELIKQLQHRLPKLRMAIISGFDDFTFARQALRYGVEEYLLKPVDKDELEQMLHKVRDKLEYDQQAGEVNQDDQLKLLLFNDTEALPKPLRVEACRQLEQTPLFQQPYFVFVMRGHTPLTIEQMRKVVSGWLANWTIVEREDRVILIVGIPSTEHADRVRELGQTLLHRLPVSYEGRLGASDVFQGTTWLREAYRQADCALQQAWYDTGKMAFTDYARILRKTKSLNHLLMQIISEFQAEMALSNYSGAQKAIHRWFEECMLLMPSWNELSEACETVLSLIAKVSPIKRTEEDELEERVMACEPEKFASKDAFMTFFLGAVDQLFVQLMQFRQENRVVDTIKQYIRHHFADELELHRLAEEVFLTPSYLSKLFKTESGETITDFLISVRIEHAKDWLKEKNGLKTYEVGEKVGYADPAYFNKVFKKVVGCTPKEFKDRVR